MLRKVNTIIMLFAVVLLSTSCFDAHEVDDYAYVTTVGVDKGVADKWRYSFQITNMRTTGPREGTGNQKAPDYITITIDAPSFFQAVNILNTSTARTLNFRHTKYLVISRDIAQEGKFTESLGTIIRFREIRRTAGVLVSTGTAEALIEEFNPKIGISLSRLQEGYIEQSSQTGFFPERQLKDYYLELKSNYSQPIAILAGINDFSHLPQHGETDVEKKELGKRKAGEIPRKGGNTIEFFGTAVFDGERMVAELNGYETRIMLMLRGEYNRGNFIQKDPLKPDLYVSVNLTQRRKPRVKVEFVDGKPVFHIKLMLDGEIMAIQSRIDYEQTSKIGYLESAIEDTIKKEAEALIEKAKELNVDFLNFGYHIVKAFPTIQEWEKYNWIGQMETAKATVEVDVKIRRTGTMIKSSPIIGAEGEQD